MSVEEPWRELSAEGAADLPTPAAYRAVQVLETLAHAHQPLTISEIAIRIPLAKSSTSNLLTSLAAAGMVRRSGLGWTLGYKVLELGQAVLSGTDVVSEFRRIVDTLPTLASETVLLAVLDGPDVLYLARHDGTQRVRLASDVGRRLPAVVTSLGKAMLASLPLPELERLLATVDELPRTTRRSHRTKDGLRRDLALTRERGYSIDDEENTIGVTCFGVPIEGTTPPMAVSTTLVTQRITASLGESLVRELTTLARQLAPLARS